MWNGSVDGACWSEGLRERFALSSFMRHVFVGVFVALLIVTAL